MLFLRQSTSTTRRIGPFVDATDGDSIESGLTIGQADIRLSKAGGDYAQSNDSGGATHDEGGFYALTLDATDTNTVGTLEVAVHVSGALYVRQTFMVLSANAFDALTGADNLDVNAAEISGDSAAADALELFVENALGADNKALISTDAQDLSGTLDVNAKAISASTAAADAVESNIGNLDAAISSRSTVTTAEVNAECDTALADYDAPTKAELDSGLAGLSIPTAAAVADAVWDELQSGHVTGGSFGEIASEIAAILADSNELQTDWADGGRLDLILDARASAAAVAALNNVSSADVNAACDTALADYDAPTKAELDSGLAGLSIPTAAAVADAVWDELQSGHATGGSFGEIASEIAAILADTNEMQTDWADGGRLDLLLDTAAGGGGGVTVTDISQAALAKFMTTDSGETAAAAGSVAKIAQGSAGGNVTVEAFTTAALAAMADTDTGETVVAAGSVCQLARGPSIVLGPVTQAVTPGNRLVSPVRLEMMAATKKTFTLTITDAAGAAVDLSDKTLRFIAITELNPPTAVFKVEGADITVAGDDNEIASVTVDATDAASANPNLLWRLIDVTDADNPELLMYGPMAITPNVTDTVGTDYPIMSVQPMTPLIPDPEDPTTFNQAWAEAQSLVGATGVVSDYSSLDNWADAFHQTVIGLFTTEQLFIQFSRSEVGTLNEAAYLAKLDAVIDLYGDKIWGINLCVEAASNAESYDIMGDDPGGRRTILAHAAEYVRGRLPDAVVTVSVNYDVVANNLTFATVVPRLRAMGLTTFAITEYIDPSRSTDIDDVTAARYQVLWDEMVSGESWMISEFGATSDETYDADDAANLAQGYVIQDKALELVHAIVVAHTAHPCLMINWAYMRDQTWLDLLAGNDFDGHGMIEGGSDFNGLQKPVYATWQTLHALYGS